MSVNASNCRWDSAYLVKQFLDCTIDSITVDY